MAITRRQFLRSSGLSALALTVATLGEVHGAGTAFARGKGRSRYRDWRDVYKDKWKWDRVVRSSHTRANCISACAWNVFVKDGIAWREEQAQVYNEAREGVPDFFPRGCQKGACYSDLMVAPTRIRYPLKRVGKRGGGKWKRVGWDEARDTVADAIIDATVENGPDTVVYDQGTTNIDFGPGTAAELRLANVLRAAHIEGWAGVGDMPMGCVQTWGMFNCEGTSDDWFNSDCIVVWSGNPVYTRIPEMHFMTEARYRGAKLIVIAPDLNATAIHADLWVNPRVESDAALALAMAQEIVAQDYVDHDYLREQTDLPFLVRRDNQRFLRESDLRARGREDAFFFWDEAGAEVALAPGTQGMGKPNLALGGIRPALEGSFKISLADGREIEVEPAFEILRRDLNERFTPEQVAGLTGVDASYTRRIAREIASARAAMIFASWGAYKHYHSDLMHRSMALLMALTGNQGKAGGGLRIASWWSVSGFEQLSARYKLRWWQNILLKFLGRPPVREMERLITERSWEDMFTPLIPWLYVHAGYADTMGKAEYNDAAGGLTIDTAMKESLERGWIPVYPRPGTDPKVLLFSAPNPLRRWPAPQVALENLWPKLDLIVNVNFRMSTTAMHCDLLLPAAGYYEKESIKYTQSYLPYIVLADKAVEPLGASREEWWIFGELARRIQGRAKAREVPEVKDAHGLSMDLKTVFDLWSDGG
ncbi:MAG: molybdopterin-dependent oxidoreductase, partial [Candidatus Binatia bacterium]